MIFGKRIAVQMLLLGSVLWLLMPSAKAQITVVYTRSGLSSIATPTFSPVSPYTGGATSVTINDTTPGVTMLYCADTTNTCTPSTPYSGPVSFPSTGFIRAQGTVLGVPSSSIASWQGTISGGGVPLYVNYCTNNASADIVSCSMNINITAGDLIVVRTKDLVASSANVTMTLSGTGACSVWAGAINATASNNSYESAIEACVVTTSGTATIQAAWSNGAATFSDISVGEYSPASSWGATPTVDGASGVGFNSSVNTIGSGFAPTGSITTAHANDLIIAVSDNFNFAQPNPFGTVTGFTERATSERNTASWYEQYATSTGTFSPSIPLNTGDASTGMIVAFRD